MAACQVCGAVISNVHNSGHLKIERILDFGRGRRVGDPGPTGFLLVQRQRAIMKYGVRAQMVKIAHRRLHEDNQFDTSAISCRRRDVLETSDSDENWRKSKMTVWHVDF